MQEKLGYKYEGIRRKKYLCLATNEYVDECITGLLKEEFIEWKENIIQIHYKKRGNLLNKEDIINSRFSVIKTSNKNLTKVKIIYKKALKFENIIITKIN